jgi:hypothetical protein
MKEFLSVSEYRYKNLMYMEEYKSQVFKTQEWNKCVA